MMKKLAILLVLLLIPSLVYGLTCSVKSSCGVGEAELFEISSSGNAHASSSSATYDSVCCSPDYTTACTGSNTLLWLSSPDNAHVATSSVPGYTDRVCFGDSNMQCQVTGTCNAPWECVVSVSGNTNAHVGDCTDYTDKLCCCDDYITEQCGDVEGPPDGPNAGPPADCNDGGSQECCDDWNDCVLGGTCYDYNQIASNSEEDMICSNNNHWCPTGYEYSGGECIRTGDFCPGGLTEPCSDPFSDWGTCFDFTPNPDHACCYSNFVFRNYYYYEWEDIIVY